MSRTIIAVHASQAGAKQDTFDQVTFRKTILTPMRTLMCRTNPIVLPVLFFDGSGPPHGEEISTRPEPEGNESFVSPSFVCAENFFQQDCSLKWWDDFELHLYEPHVPDMSYEEFVAHKLQKHSNEKSKVIEIPKGAAIPSSFSELEQYVGDTPVHHFLFT